MTADRIHFVFALLFCGAVLVGAIKLYLWAMSVFAQLP
jgi:hypothetical protein